MSDKLAQEVAAHNQVAYDSGAVRWADCEFSMLCMQTRLALEHVRLASLRDSKQVQTVHNSS